MVIHLKYGSGLGKGLSAFGESIGKGLEKRAERTALQNILSQTGTPQPQKDIGENEEFRQSFLDSIQNYENETGEMLTPPQLDMAWKASLRQAQTQQQQAPGQRQYNMQQLNEIAKRNAPLATMIHQDQMARRKAQERAASEERRLGLQEKLTYIKLNEPQMIKAGDKLERLEEQKMELGRLNELFTTHADKMPSAFTAAMFNYKGEGGMSRIGRALLKPEAQEALKLLTGQIKGLNQTFRGRILEAEIKYYMRTWPELLNTPEGKLKIMKDIELMHKTQENVLTQTQKEIEDADGRITYSEAQRKALRKTKPEFERIKKLFIRPEEKIKGQKPREGFVWMKAPDGTARQIPLDKVKEAEASGGSLIK